MNDFPKIDKVVAEETEHGTHHNENSGVNVNWFELRGIRSRVSSLEKERDDAIAEIRNQEYRFLERCKEKDAEFYGQRRRADRLLLNADALEAKLYRFAGENRDIRSVLDLAMIAVTAMHHKFTPPKGWSTHKVRKAFVALPDDDNDLILDRVKPKGNDKELAKRLLEGR